MKDKKFAVLLGLGAVWLTMFLIALATKLPMRNVMILLTFVCIGWFAYWTLSTLRQTFRKETPPPAPAPEPQPTTAKRKSNGNK